MKLLFCSSNPVVKTRGDSFRDTMVATLNSDGSWIPPFYIKTQSKSASYASGRRPAPDEKAVKGMNNQKMKEYADHLDYYVDEPTRLVMDRLSAHTARTCRDYIEAKKCSDGRQKFKIFPLPPKSAFLISPLDFGFFSYWKSLYYKYDRSTPELKLWAANQAWKSVDPNKVVEFFRNCHLIGREKPSTLSKQLHELVRASVPEKLEDVLDFYDGWLSGAFEVDGVAAPRALPFERPTMLDKAGLDGIYWNTWGSHGKKS